jgi:hypothetical protein
MAPIKKIARNCTGKDGRLGAVYECGGIESLLSDEPGLRDDRLPDADGIVVANCADVGARDGKWRIPLGAYHPLMTYLTLTNCLGFGSGDGGGRAATDGNPRTRAHGQEGKCDDRGIADAQRPSHMRQMAWRRRSLWESIQIG